MSDERLREATALLAALPLMCRAFCLECGVGVGFDEDGCCTGCGNGVCSMGDLERLLKLAGLSLVQECPAHGRLCQDARCEVREAAFR